MKPTSRLRDFPLAASLISLAAAFLSILLSTVVVFVRPTSSAFPVIIVPVAVLFALVLFTAYRLAASTVTRRFRVALIGAPGVGKTVYVTSLFDRLQTSRGGPYRFAPAAETINRVLEALNGFSKGYWSARTASDYLYLYSAKLAMSQEVTGRVRKLVNFPGGVEYDLEIADAAGEQISEFVPGEDLFTRKSSYYRYALGADSLLLCIDYPSLAGMEEEFAGVPVDEQINDLIFVMQSVAEAANVGPLGKLEVPVAVVILKCDLAPQATQWRARTQPSWRDAVDDIPRDLSAHNRHLQRLIAVAEARCRSVKVFAVTSTGPLERPGNPPAKLSPHNVELPLQWILSRGLNSRRRPPRAESRR